MTEVTLELEATPEQEAEIRAMLMADSEARKRVQRDRTIRNLRRNLLAVSIAVALTEVIA